RAHASTWNRLTPPGRPPEARYHAAVPRALAVLAALLLAMTTSIGSVFAGYTHDWRWKAPPDAAEAKRAVAEMDLLVAARRDKLVVTMGASPPNPRSGLIDDSPPDDEELLSFNGVG